MKRRPLSDIIQAKLANYRPVTPGGFFLESAWGLSAEPSASRFSVTPAASCRAWTPDSSATADTGRR
jgi:hypothetical protein